MDRDDYLVTFGGIVDRMVSRMVGRSDEPMGMGDEAVGWGEMVGRSDEAVGGGDEIVGQGAEAVTVAGGIDCGRPER